MSDEVDEPVFLGQTAGPDAGAERPKGFRLPVPRERVGHDRLDKGYDFESDPSVVLDPVTKVFSELFLKDAVPTSRDGDGTPPWTGRTHAGPNRGSGVNLYVPGLDSVPPEGARRFAETGGDERLPGGSAARKPR